jgi:chromosomal replication initiation ATPase DnaA
MLLLQGIEGSGKTHLATLWARETNGVVAVAPELHVDDVPQLVAQGRIVLEHLDGLAGLAEAEQAVFHLFNLARSEGAHVLFTSRNAPAHMKIALPDLRSRLSSVALVGLGAPDDDLLSAILAKLLGDRQLTYEPGLIPYLLPRMERSVAAAVNVVARLDAATLGTGQKLGPRNARLVLEGD